MSLHDLEEICGEFSPGALLADDESTGPMWGGHVELAVFATICEVNIVIKSKASDNHTVHTTFGVGAPTIYLLFDPATSHYDALSTAAPACSSIHDMWDGRPIVPQPRDGSCMFHALLFAAIEQGLVDEGQTTADTRRIIADWLAANPDSTLLGGNMTVAEHLTADGHASVDEYVAALRNPGLSAVAPTSSASPLVPLVATLCAEGGAARLGALSARGAQSHIATNAGKFARAGDRTELIRANSPESN